MENILVDMSSDQDTSDNVLILSYKEKNIAIKISVYKYQLQQMKLLCFLILPCRVFNSWKSWNVYECTSSEWIADGDLRWNNIVMSEWIFGILVLIKSLCVCQVRVKINIYNNYGNYKSIWEEIHGRSMELSEKKSKLNLK